MIVKGRARKDGGQLAHYLLNTQNNENVIVLETAVFHENRAMALHESLVEFDNLTSMTNGDKGLYHAQVSPEAHEDNRALNFADWIRSADILEEQLGLVAQPRSIVLHEKNGQLHGHIVWQRTDTERRVLISDSHNYPKHERAAREMELTFNHRLVKGQFTGREREPVTGHFIEPRPGFNAATNTYKPRNNDHAATQTAERTGKSPEQRKAEISALWQQSQTGAGFVAALEQSGYTLARGDKKPIHMVVEGGEVFDLRRNLDGAKKKDITERLADYPAAGLPTAAEVKARQQEATRAREEEERSHHLDALEAEIIGPRQEQESRQDTFRREAAAMTRGHQSNVIDLASERERYEATIGQEKAWAAQLAASVEAARRESVAGRYRQMIAREKTEMATRHASEREQATTKREQQRSRLEESQKARYQQQESIRQSRFRSGLAGMVDRFTGRQERTEQQNETERQAQVSGFEAERAEMSSQQRQDRLALHRGQRQERREQDQYHEGVERDAQEIVRHGQTLRMIQAVAQEMTRAAERSHAPQHQPSRDTGRTLNMATIQRPSMAFDRWMVTATIAATPKWDTDTPAERGSRRKPKPPKRGRFGNDPPPSRRGRYTSTPRMVAKLKMKARQSMPPEAKTDTGRVMRPRGRPPGPEPGF